MIYNIHSLLPEIFESFFNTGLISKAYKAGLIKPNFFNWRQNHGKGNYKQVDDKPYGGGSGMVLQVEPVYQSLLQSGGLSPLFLQEINNFLDLVDLKQTTKNYFKIEPNNNSFYSFWQKNKPTRVTILLTPRGFKFNQKIAFWLAENFNQIDFVCGRYEGFDSRVSNIVDLEISIGDYITNGGEVGAMAIIETVSRLLSGFLVKQNSARHDSFSSHLNEYLEAKNYIKNNNKDKTQTLELLFNKHQSDKNLFDNQNWRKQTMPHIEHPQFTRPEIWKGYKTPEILLDGNHKMIENWRKNWFKLV